MNFTKVEEEIIPEQLNLTVSLRGTREVRDTYQIFRLTGLLDAFSEPVFRKVIGNYIDDGPKNIILVLAQIDFIDSSGLGALVLSLKTIRSADAKLFICSINEQVKMLFELTSMDRVFEIFASREEFEQKVAKL